MARSASQYRQVRVTLTEQRDSCHPGKVRVGVRVWSKHQNQEWHQGTTVLVHDAHDLAPLADLSAVYAALLEVFSQSPLPGHIG